MRAVCFCMLGCAAIAVASGALGLWIGHVLWSGR